ncbi:hypothetical protein HPB48_014650 [Haemaphysalis longicornis]|uniref:PiggyBac transposable element-derived protein domain-containing protein n=1 Tax=Haemaphysalis longicornis TaxID=44386 RepID=A0A9J6GI31_HAELO|nr:hypothetical protein HPB48_014650 [Haemaphysalis longicornis]
MDRLGSRRPLSDKEIQEIVFLPYGEIFDVDIDSDPDDPEYDPRQELFLDRCPLEFVTNFRNNNAPENENRTVQSGSSEVPSATSSNQKGSKNSKLKPPRNWQRRHLSDVDTALKSDLPLPPDAVLSPYEYFAAFFDAEMIATLCYQTNLFSTQKNGSCIGVTSREKGKYLSILVISGIVRMPHFRMFWQTGTRFLAVAELMSRNRFEAILQCLHMNENLQAKARGTNGYDLLLKVRPILDLLKQNIRKVAPEQRQSIHEQIIPFKGRSTLKHYLKSKPHKWGYKVFTRASSSGILHDFVIYEGKGSTSEHGFGISGDAIIYLVQYFQPHVNHKLYFDNWFTSLRLVDEFKARGFLTVGTVKVDRTKKCPLVTEATFKSQGRA